MKNTFDRFAVPYLTALLLGLGALLAHPWSGVWPLAPLLPGSASAWELSKLAFWPVLAALALTGRGSGGVGGALRGGLPCLVLTPLGLFALLWLLSAVSGSGVRIAAWAAAVAAGLALNGRRKGSGHSGIWLVLAVFLGLAYVLFALLPPLWGPFLDPADAAAMAVLPC